MKRLAGIDFGLARIGIALSDERQFFASPYKTILVDKQLKKTAELIALELSKYAPLEAIVMGLPLLLNGKEGEMALKVKEFGALLKEFIDTPIIFWDERLTSLQVERSMKEGGLNRKKRSTVIDQMAAASILQNYLDYKREIS